MKRLLNCFSSDFEKMSRQELLEAIARSEGRVLVSETIGAIPPLLSDITNAELASAFGADMLILNLFDLDRPHIFALPDSRKHGVIRQVKYLCGRPVGINLEPAQLAAPDDPNPFKMTAGRLATAENAMKAVEQGVDFLVITGNPETGVDKAGIVNALQDIRNAVGDRLMLIAGKMHGSGVLNESATAIVTLGDIEDYARAGADIVLVPAPGTVPGISEAYVQSLVSRAHELGLLCMSSIGTSQEGADRETIKRIALMCKICGVDLHHIGDSGYIGMALPENILAYSIAIRGVRHSYRRLAASIRR